jgi:hypothetical protein
MRRGHTEHGHNGVSDELFERAPERLDRALGGRMVGLEEVANFLWIDMVCLARETDQIYEEHRDKLAFLPSMLGFQRCTTRKAEAGPFGVLLAAPSAAHAASLTAI